ncbi:MAG: hypothetical protein ACM3X5_07760 [Bacillota bacterium]
MRSSLANAVLALALAPAATLAALPDEIQVYTSDINKQGEFGLELHVNTTPSGRSTPDFPGEIPPAHGVRTTPEFSYGVTPSLEAGLYLPFVFGADDRDRFSGPKLRLKWMPVRVDAEGNGVFAGLNFEYAWISRVLEEATRAGELRPIVGWRDPDWLVALNPILEFAFAGPEKGKRPSFTPAFKVSRRVAEGYAAGFEYYADLGPIGNFAPRSEQSHSLYLALDVDKAPWVFNVGVGRGWSAADRWTVKAIFEVPL